MDMYTKQTILSRLLPKTGQSVEYYVPDDGTYQKGWWKGLTLGANKERFIPRTLAGKAVVIDNATGLMWPTDMLDFGCNRGEKEIWEVALSTIYVLNFAGFTDWRVPNINELLSIVDYSEYNPSIYTEFFPYTPALPFWASTTDTNSTDEKWYVHFLKGHSARDTKDRLPYNIRAVRSL
ncbi:unnamed protein product [marine sediment metagenome]|uniref:Lcl C-terminal domain-containing protein n=1 Tax=marine sediment metagenome TaxID=412755 RepID=X1AT09_9ZZZZ